MVSVRIPLENSNLYAHVSVQDAERVLAFKWYAWNRPHAIYARRGDGTQTPMHAMIAGKNSDHRDRDGLNNTRSNIRAADESQQKANRRLFKNNASGHTGVRAGVTSGTWTATIQMHGKRTHLGTFPTIEQAIAAREQAETDLFGEFRPLR